MSQNENSSFSAEGRPLIRQEAPVAEGEAAVHSHPHPTISINGNNGLADPDPAQPPASPPGRAPNRELSYGGTQERTESGVVAEGNSPRRLVRRPSQLTARNKLDPDLLVKKTRVAQGDGGKELLISRFTNTLARGIVSDVAIANKPHMRVGAHLSEADYDDYGQWVSEANNTFDSLDFDDNETVCLQEARAKKDGKIDPPGWQKWVIVLLAGILTGLVAFGIDKGIYYLMAAKFMAVEQYLHTPSEKYLSNSTHPDASEKTMEAGVAVIVYTLINLCYVSVAAVLVIFGEPLAKGSGIGEIKCFLNGIKLSRVVRLKTLCCKAIGILFSVASGLPCGKEGPMIHSGAAIAAGVSTGKSSKFHFDSGFFKEFRSDLNKRNFVTAGAAAGVGVAFGAPIGGLLFAVEEVGSFWNLDLTFMVFLCAAVAPFTLQLVSHPTGIASSNGLIDFGTVKGEYNYYDIPFVALLGVVGALIGTAFIKLNMIQTKWRKKHCKTKAHRFIEVLCVSALVSLGLILLVCYGYTCIEIPPVDDSDTKTNNEALFKDIKKFGCNSDEYNDMATYFFRSMEDTIHLMTHSNELIDYKTLILHFAIFYPLTIMTYGIHVPSGLFLPTLALGCTVGHIYAQLWNTVLPAHFQLTPSDYALFGATAVLGGLVRMTISVIVIMMECTANTTFFYPLCLVTVICKMVGDRFTHGIYDEHIFLNHIPLLESHVERPEMNMMCVGDVMNADCVLVKEVLSVSDLILTLKAHPFCNSIIVVDSEGVLKGVLLRRTALIIIDKRAWDNELTLEDFKKTSKEREYLKLKKYRFFERVPKGDDHKLIDLRRYIDLWPYTFLGSTPLPRVYRTFKELGLRHLIVVNEHREPIGIVGRKQLTYLEMADPRCLPAKVELSNVNMTSHLSTQDIESDASPITLHSWRALDKWQEAYRKGVN